MVVQLSQSLTKYAVQFFANISQNTCKLHLINYSFTSQIKL